MKNIIKTLWLLAFLISGLTINAQDINLIRFNNTPNYASGSGVSVIINPTGVFDLNNQFILQLSGVGGSWTSPTTLTTVSEFYVPVINGTLPTGLTAGNYKLRVISTLPKDTVETGIFKVVTTSAISTSILYSLINPNANLFNCTSDTECTNMSGFFGTLNRAEGATTSSINQLNNLKLQICTYDPSYTYEVKMTDISNSTTSSLNIINTNQVIIPSNLPIGTYIFELIKSKGGATSITSVTFLFHGNATNLGNTTSENICVGLNVAFNIDISMAGIGRNYPGSKYTIDFGDGTSTLQLTHAQLLANPNVTKIYNSVSCSTANGFFTVNKQLLNKGISNNCIDFSQNGNGAQKNINTSLAPVADFNLAEKQCINTQINLNNTTILGQYGATGTNGSGCSNAAYFSWSYKKPGTTTYIDVPSSWVIAPNYDLIVPANQVNTAGCWEFQLKAVNQDFCETESQKIKTIKIESVPVASFTYPQSVPLCTGNTITFTNTSNVANQACQEPTYLWTITPITDTGATSNGFTPQPGSYTTKNISIKFTQPGSYKVLLSVTNSCKTDTISKIIENLGDPSVSFNPTSASICEDAPADYTVDFNTTYKPNYSKGVFAPKTYEWTISGAGVVASDYEYTSGTSASAFPKIIFKAYKTFSIKVKVNGSCNGSNEATFNLTLKETPVITNGSLTQTICSGISSAPITLTSSVSGTTYTWEVIKTANISTNINNGTSSTIPGVIINNNSTTSGTVTYRVTPTANGCIGNSKDFVITVNPIPIVLNLTETICSGYAFNKAPTDGNGNIVPTGTKYTWLTPVSNPIGAITGGSAQSGVSSISQTLINTTNVPATLTYTVTPKSGASGSCDGQIFTVTITVNPTPKIADKTIGLCNGGNFTVAPTNTTPDIVPSGTTYTWTAPLSNPVGAITGSSAQITGVNSISQNIQNIKNSQATLTYNVVPIANGCTGSAFRVTVTVNPTPKISNKTATICSGETFSLSPTNINGDIVPTNTTYTWTTPNSQSGITGESSGSNQPLISGTLTNTNTTPKIVTYTITPVSGDVGSCAGPSFTFAITVNPKPISLGLTNKIYCNGTVVPLLNLTNNVSGTTYTWTNSNPSIGLAANSLGNVTSIPSFTATNNTSSPITATIKLYATYTNAGQSCNGAMEQFDITVNPAAVVTFSKSNQTKCSGETTEEVTLGSATANVSFAWSATKPAGITGTFTTLGTSSIPAQTLENITNAPIDITYSATGTVSGGANCPGAVYTYIIRINPKPQINSTINTNICSGNAFSVTPQTTGNTLPTGTTYSWGIPTVTGGITGGASGNNVALISGTLTNTTNTTQTATYTVTPTANGCNGPTFDVVVTVNSKPVIANKSLTVCSGINFTVNLTEPGNIIPANSTYTWGVPTVTGSLAGGVSGNNLSTISGNLTNTTNTNQTATYIVTPTSGSTGNCPGNSFTITITVKPALKATISTSAINACLNSGSPTITLTGINGTPPYTFTYKLNGGADIDLQTTGVSSSATINVPTTNVTSNTYSLVKITDASANSCTQTVTGNVVVNITDIPNITSAQNQTICSGTTFNISPVNGGANIVPTGTTYTWGAPTISPTASAITGGSAQSAAQTSIGQTLTNTTDQIATATYTVTPKSGSCPGATFQGVVTVNPSPKVIFSDADNKQTLCSGATSDAVNLSSVTTGDVAFSWEANVPAGITGASASGTNIIPTQTLSNSTNIPLDVTYTAKAALNNSGTCFGSDFYYKITVNPVAKVNAISNIKLCNNEQSTIIPFGSNVTGTIYKWENDNTLIGLGATGNGNLPVFTATNTGIVPIIATITVTPTANGCEGTKSTFTITINPTPTVDKPADQTVCNGFKTTDINFTGNIATTTYNWTNDKPTIGLTATGSGNIPAFTAVNTGTAAITATITVTPVDGCSGTPITFTIIVNPSPAVNFSIQNQILCSGGTTGAVSLSSPSAGAVFTWTAVQPANIEGVVTSGTNTIPAQTLINKTNSPIQVIYTAYAEIAGFSCMGAPKEYIITVNPTPLIVKTEKDTICSGTSFNLVPLDGEGNIVPSGTTYTWSAPVISPSVGAITGGSAQNTAQSSISQTLTNTTDQIATATYTVTPKSGSCDGATFQVVVTVNPSPKVIFSDVDNKQTLCSGATSDAVNLSSVTTGDVAFSWTANVPTGITGTTPSGTNTIPAQTLSNSTNAPLDVTYTAKAALNNSGTCFGSNFDYKITVNPVAKVNAVSNIKLCNNEQSTVIAFGSNVTGTTYKWENDNTSIGLSTTGNGTIPVFTATNTGIVPIIATITVTPTANGCEGTKNSFTITINPTPTVDKPADQTVCNGFKTTDINFTENIATTTYNWTNDKPAIGLAAIGSGNIPEFTAVNTGTAAITATITVTPVDGCSGTPITFTITVNPSPAVNFSIQNQTICSGGATTTVNLSSPSAGAVFTWTAVQPTNIEGVITSGTNTIPTQTLINKTSTPIQVKYTAYAEISGFSCIGATKEYIVTVNPTPYIVNTEKDTICSGTSFNIIPLDGLPNIVPIGTTYTWGAPTISPTASAITGGSVQSAAQTSIGQTLTNTTDQIATATYTVTPKSGSCDGATFQVVVTVNPSPKVIFSDVDNKQTLCSGATSDAVNLSSVTTGDVAFSWTANVPTGITGTTPSGTNTIPAQTLSNSTNAPLDVTYTAKAALNNSGTCFGSNFDYKITVNPVAKVNAVSNIKLCNNEQSTVIAFGSNVTGTTYKWENDNTSIGLSTTGNGTIPVFTATNTGIVPIIATITVTPTANGCEGTKNSFTITINPTPTVDKPADQTVCNGFKTTDINFTENIATTTYNWTNDKPAIGLAAIGSGNIPEFTAVNTGTAAITATITVTPVDGCSGNPKTFTITVNPSPAFTQHPQSESVCIDGAPKILTVSYKNGTGIPKFEWYSNTVKDSTSGTLILTETTANYIPSTSTVGVMYYYCVLTFTSAGCSSITSNIATFTVNPLPTISTEPLVSQKICVGGVIAPLAVAYTGGTGTATYQWYSNTINANSGGSQIALANAASYTPSAFNSVGTYYFYCIVSLNGSGCGSASSQTAKVEVLADPVVTAPLATQTVCQSTAPATLSVTASGGEGAYSYQWYSNASNSVVGGTVLISAVNASFIPPTDVVGTKYYYCSVTQTGLGCATLSAVAEVIVKLAPTIVDQPKSSTVCKDETPTQLSVTYKDGAGSPLYQWYSNSVDDRTTGTVIPDATTNTYNPSGATVGTVYYYCIITLPTGGCSSLTSNIAKVTVNQYPVISDFSRLIGSGTSFTVQPLPVSGKDIVPAGTIYTWSMPEIDPINSISGASAQSNPQALISQTLTNNTKAIATVTYTVHPVSVVCSGAEFKIVVTVNPPINPNTITTDISCYNANDGSISTNIQGGIPPYIIMWTGPNGFSSSLPAISNLKPGDYTLKISDNGGLPFTEVYTVNEPKEIILSTVEEKDITCNGAANGEISISVTGGKGNYFYAWTKNNIAFSTTEDISNLEPGEYKVSVTDANNCGPKTQIYTITEPEPLKITLTNKVDNLCAGDKNGSLSVTVSGGTKIETSPGVFEYQNNWIGANGFTSTSANISNLYSGKYKLSVTDKSGCNTDFEIEVDEPDSITINYTSTPITCYGADDASITLLITGGVQPYKGQWSNLASGLAQQNLSAGDYTIVVTDSNHCQKSITINVPEAPVFKITPVVKQISCFGAHDGSIKLNIEGGQGNVSLKWSDNSTAGNERNNIGPGTYTVTITDGKPCYITRTFIIQEPLELKISAKTKNAFDCNNTNSGAIDLEVTGGTLPYNFAWSNGMLTEDLTNIPPGNYFVEVTDARACTQSETFEITRQLPIAIKVETGYNYNCVNKRLTQLCNAKVSGGIPPYKLTWSSGNISGTNNEIMETDQTASIILTVEDALGCNKSYMFNTNVPNTGINNQLLNCNNHTFQFNFTIPDKILTNISYVWDFGDGATAAIRNPTHTYMNQGTYPVSVKVTSIECTTTFNELIVVDSLPVLRLDKPAKLCKNDSVKLFVTGADFYDWSDGSKGDSIVIKLAGDYQVTGTTKNGCTAVLNFTATYYDNVNYSIITDKDEITPEDPTVKFWSQEISLSKYLWDFGDGNTDYGNYIYHSYDVNRGGYIEVLLTATNPNGCIETATKKIWMSLSAMPNTFTPNGDGNNDVFLKGWNLQVYNSNGVLLYEGTDGWNGTYNGKPVSSDTYYYVVVVYTPKGSESKANFVTIVR